VGISYSTCSIRFVHSVSDDSPNGRRHKRVSNSIISLIPGFKYSFAATGSQLGNASFHQPLDLIGGWKKFHLVCHCEDAANNVCPFPVVFLHFANFFLQKAQKCSSKTNTGKAFTKTR